MAIASPSHGRWSGEEPHLCVAAQALANWPLLGALAALSALLLPSAAWAVGGFTTALLTVVMVSRGQGGGLSALPRLGMARLLLAGAAIDAGGLLLRAERVEPWLRRLPLLSIFLLYAGVAVTPYLLGLRWLRSAPTTTPRRWRDLLCDIPPLLAGAALACAAWSAGLVPPPLGLVVLSAPVLALRLTPAGELAHRVRALRREQRPWRLFALPARAPIALLGALAFSAVYVPGRLFSMGGIASALPTAADWIADALMVGASTSAFAVGVLLLGRAWLVWRAPHGVALAWKGPMVALHIAGQPGPLRVLPARVVHGPGSGSGAVSLLGVMAARRGAPYRDAEPHWTVPLCYCGPAGPLIRSFLSSAACWLAWSLPGLLVLQLFLHRYG